MAYSKEEDLDCPKMMADPLGVGETGIKTSNLGSHLLPRFQGDSGGRTWLGSLTYKVVFNVVL